jgi:hypothetical protein
MIAADAYPRSRDSLRAPTRRTTAKSERTTVVVVRQRRRRVNRMVLTA